MIEKTALPEVNRARIILIAALVTAMASFAAVTYYAGERKSAACRADWSRLHGAIDAGVASLRAAEPAGAAQRLARRLAVAAAQVREQARVHCDQGGVGIPTRWLQRAGRIELAVPAILAASLTQPKGSDMTRLPGLVELVNASANANAEFDSLALAPFAKDGGTTTPIGPIKLSALWRCGSPVDRRISCTQPPSKDEERSLIVSLMQAAHLYVLVYDEVGHLRVAYPSRPGHGAQTAGDVAIRAHGWLKTGHETVLTVASDQRLRGLEALIGAPQSSVGGAHSKSARQALASLALIALDPTVTGRVAQIRVRP